MIELRWTVPDSTTTERPRLQYRVLSNVGLGTWSGWLDVPTVVVPCEPVPATSAADILEAATNAPNEAKCAMCNGRGFYGTPGGRCSFCKGSGKLQWRSAGKTGEAAASSAMGDDGDGTPEQEAFCTGNCCWSGHHPDCLRASPSPSNESEVQQ